MAAACLGAGNDHAGEPLRFRAERILLARDLGMACFDVQHYLESSSDLQVSCWHMLICVINEGWAIGQAYL